jgi:hypothetical protein
MTAFVAATRHVDRDREKYGFFDKSKMNYETNQGGRLLDPPIEPEGIPMISVLQTD